MDLAQVAPIEHTTSFECGCERETRQVAVGLPPVLTYQCTVGGIWHHVLLWDLQVGGEPVMACDLFHCMDI